MRQNFDLATSKELVGNQAWIVAPGGLLLFARSDHNHDVGSPSQFTRTPLTKLVYGINQEFGVERFRYLRIPIETNYKLSNWERGVVKVCAKRNLEFRDITEAFTLSHRHLDVGRVLEAGVEQYRCDNAIGTFENTNEALKRVLSVEKDMRISFNSQKKFQRHRCVAVTILDPNGKVLVTATNSNAKNQMLHAEVNAFAQLTRHNINELAPGSTVVTTLKPCIMCANLILEFTRNKKDVKVLAAQDDFGSFGRHSILGETLEIVAAT
jgi:tRNA(Arg) A34 adenosine deaminase TadA